MPSDHSGRSYGTGMATKSCNIRKLAMVVLYPAVSKAKWFRQIAGGGVMKATNWVKITAAQKSG